LGRIRERRLERMRARGFAMAARVFLLGVTFYMSTVKIWTDEIY
jgi:hypothetical protein